MRHEEVSQILLSSHFAHDLGNGQCTRCATFDLLIDNQTIKL